MLRLSDETFGISFWGVNVYYIADMDEFSPEPLDDSLPLDVANNILGVIYGGLVTLNMQNFISLLLSHRSPTEHVRVLSGEL